VTLAKYPTSRFELPIAPRPVNEPPEVRVAAKASHDWFCALLIKQTAHKSSIAGCKQSSLVGADGIPGRPGASEFLETELR